MAHKHNAVLVTFHRSFKNLAQSSSNSIEMRICRDQASDDEDVYIEKVDILYANLLITLAIIMRWKCFRHKHIRLNFLNRQLTAPCGKKWSITILSCGNDYQMLWW